MTAHGYTQDVDASQGRASAQSAEPGAARSSQPPGSSISEGKTPSIDDIAEAADVSRRTIYLYFPTLDQLVLDASVGLLSESTVDAALDTERLRRRRRGSRRRARQRLRPDRRRCVAVRPQDLRLTVDAPRAVDGARRGYRRIEWIERAVEPLRPRLTDEQHQRLVSSLAVVLGWEAMIVLRDVRGLDTAQEEAAMRWAARALVEAMISEADVSG